MSASAQKKDPQAFAAAPLPVRPRLEVAQAAPTRSAARNIAGYAAGMAGGFALAAIASAPGGLDVVVGQGRLVLAAVAVATLAVVVDIARRRRSAAA